MEATVLDTNFSDVGIVDAFESFIWTDRYQEAGDFEIYAPATAELIQLLKQGYYLWRAESKHLMIVENIRLTTDIEEGIYLTVSGESLESILRRRIVYPTMIEGNLQNGIKQLLDENIINPENENRKISNFVFKESTDSNVTKHEITLQYNGEGLYESICELCVAFDIGFRITLNSSNQFVFELYSGVDRSYDQDSRPFIEFSPDFENLSSTDYYESSVNYKNAALVAGEGEEPDRTYLEVEYSDAVGLARREMLVDAASIRSEYYEETTDSNGETTSEKVTLTEEEYTALLQEEGELSLDETDVTETFEGIVDSSHQYVYGTDYSIGDIVQITNEFEMTAKSRITEIIFCHNMSGISITPTFVGV